MEYQKFTELYFYDNETSLEGSFKVDTKIWQELCEEEADLTDDETIWSDYGLIVGVNGVISLTVDTTDGFFIVDIVKA
jgi:hypothetical protein